MPVITTSLLFILELSKTKDADLAPLLLILFTGLTGLEPATSAVTGQRSNQLSYNPNFSDIYDYHLNFYGCQEFGKNKVVMFSAGRVASILSTSHFAEYF